MKRLTFKPEHIEPILAGTKRQTCRWRDLKIHEGDVVAAVTGANGKPAFLVPAKDAFARLIITSVRWVWWKDFTEEDAAKSGVTRDWYLRENPDARDMSRIWIIEFEVVAHG